MNKIIIFFLTFFILLHSKSFSEIEIKKIKNKNIEVIRFQSPDTKFPDKDDVLAQIHFPKNIN
jgi:hypothetical protein